MRIYGPVPSRRFGLSLGVDIVPHKTCPLDCIYCQLGEEENTSVTLQEFYPIDQILKDVENALEEGPRPDVITLAGSGEPGLYSSLGELIDGLKELSDVPVLLITNGVLLTDERVAAAALKADILAPSLDAGDEETFIRINKPHADLVFDDVVAALQKVTHAHKGQVQLEIMLIKEINDDRDSMERIAAIARTLRFDQIDLNTPVRPPVPERGALPCDEDTLALARTIFGEKAQAINKFAAKPANLVAPHSFDDQDKNIRETVLRRPCTFEDLCASLGIAPDGVRNSLDRLLAAGLVFADEQENDTYYRAAGPNPTIRNIK